MKSIILLKTVSSQLFLDSWQLLLHEHLKNLIKVVDIIISLVSFAAHESLKLHLHEILVGETMLEL